MREYTLIHGDCLDILPTLAAGSVDAVICDPPYGLAFMGKDWDHGVPGVHFWREALRVAKPGAHLLAFGGTRTFHRLAVAIEDAGWEIRDTIMWVYGSGFPKSLDVSKAIDKAAGAEREKVRTPMTPHSTAGKGLSNELDERPWMTNARKNGFHEHAGNIPSTPDAQRWQGWGTALKPAWEPIIVARKPLIGTVAQNVLAHGTGAINVDGCRVEANGEPTGGNGYIGLQQNKGWNANNMPYKREQEQSTIQGRWPANVIHDGSEEVFAGFPVTTQAGSAVRNNKRNPYGSERTWSVSETPAQQTAGYPDTGSAARFFYCAKASKADRDDDNGHPTVKPTDLMRYLCRLVTPPEGVVLDPFCGSGSTGKGAVLEGFRFVGIDKEAEYLAIAEARIQRARQCTDMNALPMFAGVG